LNILWKYANIKIIIYITSSLSEVR